ncbi:MAG: hypothetical protein M9938_09355 [Solirubrobacterales bacterium]|nr:hypothetical protein [Solirubrobacterales bacterium]
MTRFLVFFATAVAAVVLVFAGLASAAQPQTGGFSYFQSWVGGAYRHSVSFTVVRARGKTTLKRFVVKTSACGGTLVLGKTVKVKANGKFASSGKMKLVNGSSAFLYIDGKFVSRRKAKGKVTFHACPLYVINFEAVKGGKKVIDP